MPSVSDYVLDNMTVDGKIYENQFVFFKIVSVEQSTETQLKFDLQYIIQDKKENSEFYDPSLKTLKFKFNGSLTSLDTIEFTLNTSPSFNLKKSIMIAAIERYSELNVMYHDFLKL
jgi:hypothetical protein